MRPADHLQSRRCPRRRLRAHATVGALIAAGVLVAGCGGGGPNPAVANVSTSSTPSSHSSSASTYNQALAYAKCVRTHGVPLWPDPDSNGEFDKSKLSPRQLGVSMATAAAAQHACRALLPTYPATQQPQDLAQALRFSRCMRAHGSTNFPTPKATAQSESRTPSRTRRCTWPHSTSASTSTECLRHPPWAGVTHEHFDRPGNAGIRQPERSSIDQHSPPHYGRRHGPGCRSWGATDAGLGLLPMKIALTGTAVALAAAATALALSLPSGTYTTTISRAKNTQLDGRWTVTFSPGHYVVSAAGRQLVTGTDSASDGVLTLHDTGGPAPPVARRPTRSGPTRTARAARR